MKLFRSVLVVATAAAIAACTPKAVQPLFETFTVDTLLNDGASECRVQYRFESIANSSMSPALQAIEQTNICYFFELEEFSGSVPEAAEAAIKQLAADIRLPGQRPTEWHTQSYDSSAEAEIQIVDTLLSFTIIRSSYMGGAHGMYETVTHTYSIAGGYEVVLEDLFDEPQRQQLNDLIHKKLYEKFGVKDDQGLAGRGFFPQYIAPTSNFRVTVDGITFYYNPYEIGCYALGSIEMSISLDELEALKRLK